ncbi:COX15/CtaA family protein [Acidipila sp. EB88]|uniref:COX15/CtaA family protein n=1 Tax=Acidipila sp. EB88 TaxID=2305226 RepID=UPI000F5FF11D|nr:COX15/CtaA family protein [Acidipila sp. EB88]RRA47359.1 cytochrome oxidase assembly protein [Acidipila sp. EB88]
MASPLSIPAHRPGSAALPLSGASAASSAQPPASPSLALQRYSWAVVAYNVLVILWGAVVRATGSGNGCGEHWPLCGGTMVQHWKTVASMIEYAHRATSGIAVIALVGLVAWCWRSAPRRHIARVFAATAAVLTFNEALLGALLVLLGHTGTDQSPMRAFWLSLHLANTLLLLAALALTAHFLSRINGRMRGGVELTHAPLAFVGLAATLCVGVSGSLAALGDTLYPAHSLAEAFAQDFSPSANWLLHIRWIHPTLSFVAGAWILFLVIRTRDAGYPALRAMGNWVASLVGIQIVLGVADVLLLAPTWLQVTHLLGADLLWIGLVVLSAQYCIRPIGCAGANSACAVRARADARAQKPLAATTGA